MNRLQKATALLASLCIFLGTFMLPLNMPYGFAETEPYTEEPSTEDPSTEEPPTEDPSTEEPPTEDPSAEEPPTEDPSAEEPPTEDPSAEDPSAEEPSAEEPSAEEPSAEEPSAEDPSTEDPSAEEPSDEEPSDEEPSAEEPSAEDPSTEEPSAEEPIHQLSGEMPLLTLPPELNLNEGSSASLTLSGMNGTESEPVHVTVSSANCFYLKHTESGHSLSYILYCGEQPISSESTLSFTENGSVTLTVAIGDTDGIPGGTYTDTLTFTVSQPVLRQPES